VVRPLEAASLASEEEDAERSSRLVNSGSRVDASCEIHLTGAATRGSSLHGLSKARDRGGGGVVDTTTPRAAQRDETLALLLTRLALAALFSKARRSTS